MSDNVAKYVYWIATGLVALVYLGAAAFYISSHDMVAGMYREVLGYPTYIIWPLAILKIVGAVVILWRPSAVLADLGLCGNVLASGARLRGPCGRRRSGLVAGSGDLGTPDRLVADRQSRACGQVGLCTGSSGSANLICCGVATGVPIASDLGLKGRQHD
ncbi:DoxX family protein [Sedimentitalea todarodis]|uniref:DoxX-like family protein n=1 Tax=Sedimentitalea todarodis TaxID=1631240 RepID=A0ABU3VEN3_9RHOB|nr:DoxX family protein [Sedimentitalea todarodis]MDU9004641.1 hypothetical protein [Sedimentitalea todarodis]